MPARSTVVALARSCHPVPTIAVTTMGTALAVAAGNPPLVVLLMLAAVLAGQLSIGWSNDLIDADRDRTAQRRDKPIAAGAISRRALAVALSGATVAVVPLSVSLGWAAGSVHLLAVAFGWLYNLGLKSTILSPVAYAVAFGALPAVATLARAAPALPPWWVTVAGALLGIGAHFGNVLPDLEDDLRAGVRGAPQRAGRLGAAVVAAVAVTAAAVLLASAGPLTVGAALLTVLVAALAAFVVASGSTGRRLRMAFGATMLAAALCLVMLVLQGGLAA